LNAKKKNLNIGLYLLFVKHCNFSEVISSISQKKNQNVRNKKEEHTAFISRWAKHLRHMQFLNAEEAAWDGEWRGTGRRWRGAAGRRGGRDGV
jgi:hypothetical protein